MSRTVSPSSGKPYGLALVCRTWRAPRATVYRCWLPFRPEPAGRPGPVGPMSDTALLAAIRAVLAGSPFHGEGHRKIWARLRVAGVRTSKRRVLRLTRENDLLAPSRVGSPRGPRSHDGTIIPEAVDMMWGTDLTTTITGEGQAAVFIAIDHCSAECVGIHAAPRASRFEALEPIRQSLPPRRRGACVSISVASPRASHAASQSVTTTDRNTCPTRFRKSSNSSASKARLPSSGRPRETAAPSASSERSRRTSCGSGPSIQSRTFATRCSRSVRPTTPLG